MSLDSKPQRTRDVVDAAPETDVFVVAAKRVARLEWGAGRQFSARHIRSRSWLSAACMNPLKGAGSLLVASENPDFAQGQLALMLCYLEGFSGVMLLFVGTSLSVAAVSWAEGSTSSRLHQPAGAMG